MAQCALSYGISVECSAAVNFGWPLPLSCSLEVMGS
jgi:hypothetical protein